MIVVKMPAGAIEYVNPKDLLWMRNAFASEWKGAVMLRIGGGRIYSIETLEELDRKFTDAGARLAAFTPPEGKMKMIVNAENVREVEAGNPDIFHEKARAVLIFSPTTKLAVRETEAEAQQKLSGATSLMA
jgi:hypothetical protein